jgi:RNA polymerase sigma-70 factor (ECF subfamily)
MADSGKSIAQLLRKAQAGDAAALQEVCTELQQLMRWYFIRKFQDMDIVDDLSQETYLRFIKNISRIEDPVKIKGFVLKVAFHVMQDYFRQRYRRNESPIYRDIPQGEIKSSLYGSSDANTDSDYVLRKVDFEVALNKLPEKTQQILRMKADGYRYEEIAETLKLSVSGVKMQVKRGIVKLKSLM